MSAPSKPWSFKSYVPVSELLPYVRSVKHLAELAGVTRSRLYRRGGQLSLDLAEQLAEAIGFLPIEIWPDWPDKVLAEDRCGTPQGYKAHRSAGEEACAGCKAAHASHNRAAA